MFNILSNQREEKGSYGERSHQDNFYSDSSYNNEFQYCAICGSYNRFEYDRCVNCGSN